MKTYECDFCMVDVDHVFPHGNEIMEHWICGECCDAADNHQDKQDAIETLDSLKVYVDPAAGVDLNIDYTLTPISEGGHRVDEPYRKVEYKTPDELCGAPAPGNSIDQQVEEPKTAIDKVYERYQSGDECNCPLCHSLRAHGMSLQSIDNNGNKQVWGPTRLMG